MSFDQLLGQPYAKQVLSASLLANRAASALLFFGPQGVGKKIAAIAFAQALMTPLDASQDAARILSRRIEEGTHPDVRIFKPAGSSFKVEQVRDIVRECSMKPFEGARRIFILDKVELLSAGAGNALLKTLEEPPEGTTFILISSQRDKLLPTIASRAQPVRFSPLGEATLMRLLEQRNDFSEAERLEAARLSGGSLSMAEHLLGEEGQHLKELAEGFLEAVFADAPLAQMNWAQGAAAERRLAPQMMDLVGVYLRDLWCRKNGFPEELNMLKQPPRHGGGLSPQRLELLMGALGQLRQSWGRRPSLNLALALETLVTSAPNTAAA